MGIKVMVIHPIINTPGRMCMWIPIKMDWNVYIHDGVKSTIPWNEQSDILLAISYFDVTSAVPGVDSRPLTCFDTEKTCVFACQFGW